MQLLVVAVVGGDIEDAGETAAEVGREASFVECDVLDGIGIEGGEEATHVADIVEWHTVEKEEVLVGSATTDVEATVAF